MKNAIIFSSFLFSHFYNSIAFMGGDFIVRHWLLWELIKSLKLKVFVVLKHMEKLGFDLEQVSLHKRSRPCSSHCRLINFTRLLSQWNR